MSKLLNLSNYFSIPFFYKKNNKSEITDEQRSLIKKYFPTNNGLMKNVKGTYLFTHHVYAAFDKGTLVFSNERGILVAEVSYYTIDGNVINTEPSSFQKIDVLNEKVMCTLKEQLSIQLKNNSLNY